MLKLFKSLINPALKLRASQFGYASQTKNIFSLPKRQFIHPTALGEVTAAIKESYTTRMLAYLFRDNIKYFLDLHVSSIFEHIVSNKLQVDDTMNSIIIPITIEYINVFTIQNGASLGQIAFCAAKLDLHHQKLWEAILRKLDGQEIYKYLTLEQTVRLLNALVKQGTYINHPLIPKLSGVVAQQKAFYQNFPQLLSLIRRTNKIIQQKGPKTLQITQAYKQLA